MAEAAKKLPEPRPAANPVAETFLTCLGNARHETWPFDHWLLRDVLPAGFCEAITNLPFEPPEDAVFSGKRETNNHLRVFFTRENQAKFVVFRRVVEGFQDADVRHAIERTTGADLTDTRLRIEYCQDTPGFWLEPHTDILVKKFTMVIYMSDDPGLLRAGTDIHEGPPDFKYVGSAPHGRNLAVVFIPGDNTWHGVGHHPVKGIRKSLIVNYVASDWRDTWELA